MPFFTVLGDKVVAALIIMPAVMGFHAARAEPIQTNMQLQGSVLKTYQTGNIDKCRSICADTVECTGLNFVESHSGDDCTILTGDLKEDPVKNVFACRAPCDNRKVKVGSGTKPASDCKEGQKGCAKSKDNKVCMTFENLPVWVVNRPPPFGENGIVASVEDFVRQDGSINTGGYARVDAAPPYAIGNGKTLRLNNASLRVDISQIGFKPRVVGFEFLDMGGYENITADNAPTIVGEIAASPTPIGGYDVRVVTTVVPNGKDVQGSFFLNGPVASFDVGGQELWIDTICVSD
jgi:hypothetical protein